MSLARVFYIRYYDCWCVVHDLDKPLIWGGSFDEALKAARAIVEAHRARIRRSL